MPCCAQPIVGHFSFVLADIFHVLSCAKAQCLACNALCFGTSMSAGEPVDQYCARLLKATGVLLLPATLYDHETSIDAGHFRLGLGRRNFAECIGKWEEFIRTDH